MIDKNEKQYWMIWGNGPTQKYECTQKGFRITNGTFTYNRPLYARNESSVTLAGDKPQVMLAQAPSSKYGSLSLGVIIEDRSKWLHDFETIVASYNPGMQLYTLADPILPSGIELEVLPLADDPGFIMRMSSNNAVKLLWVYGGLSSAYHIIGQSGYEGSIISKECSDEIYIDERGNRYFRLNNPSLGKTVFGACTAKGTFHICGSQFSESPLDLLDPQSKASIGIKKDGRLRHPDTYESHPILAQEVTISPSPSYFVAMLSDDGDDGRILELLSRPGEVYESALRRCQDIQGQIIVETPDEGLNLAVRAICASMDATWHSPSFMHGTLRWGYESGGWFLGWRGWYGPTAFGWHDRVARAIRFHSRYQLDGPERGPDSMGKVWPYIPFSGTIEHRPNGIYDMTQVYLDHIYYYYHWTGDKALLKELFPMIEKALNWEKREFDPDGDGLYENFANTWISDGHWYSGGGCTQASAYNYRANLLAAEAAKLAGVDGNPYLRESEGIRRAMGEVLWLRREGHFAEYKELLGQKRLHEAAEAPTIYHPIDFHVMDDFQSYQSLRYLEERLWKFDDLILVNDWYPVIVTNGTLALAEVLNTAVAYYRIGEEDKAYRLLRASLRSFYHARIPGEISCYVNERGDQGTYAGFTDAISMFGRTVVEGLFGILPKMQEGAITIQPAFPESWNHARIVTPLIEYSYHRDGMSEKLTTEASKEVSMKFRMTMRENHIQRVTLDGAPIPYTITPGIGKAFIEVDAPHLRASVLEVRYSEGREGRPRLEHKAIAVVGTEYRVEARSCRILESYDPQDIFTSHVLTAETLGGRLNSLMGHHTFFLKIEGGEASWWEPIDIEVREAIEVLNAELLPTREGKAFYKYELRNNSPESWHLEVVTEVAGRRHAEDISMQPNSSHTFNVYLESTTVLTPGTNVMWVRISGDLVLDLAIPVKFWGLFDVLPDGRPDFIKRCEPVPIPYNDSLSDIFRHDFAHPRSPYTSLEIDIHGLNAWTGSWYTDRYVNTDHIVEQLTPDNTFVSDVGVPFSQERTGRNGLFTSLWDIYPSSERIPIKRTGSKMYLLVAGTTHNSQTYIANGLVRIRYSDGSQQTLELFNPTNYDSMFQHFSDNYPQWIGGKRNGYYGVGTASGIHADILDIPLESKTVDTVEISCLSNEIVIGLLGITIYE